MNHPILFQQRLLAVAMGCLLSLATPAVAKMLKVTTIWQETSQWCWAASGQMLMQYVGTNTAPPPEVPQCYQANELFGRTDCCSCPTPTDSGTDPGCIRPGWPQLDKWGYNSTVTPWGTALTWSQLTAEINNGRPFMLSWAWHGGGGHAMVGIGYRRIVLSRSIFQSLSEVQRLPPIMVERFWPTNQPSLAINFVLINNPWPWQGRCGSGENASGPFGADFEMVTYAAFDGGAGFNHDHGSDIYNIIRR